MRFSLTFPVPDTYQSWLILTNPPSPARLLFTSINANVLSLSCNSALNLPSILNPHVHQIRDRGRSQSPSQLVANLSPALLTFGHDLGQDFFGVYNPRCVVQQHHGSCRECVSPLQHMAIVLIRDLGPRISDGSSGGEIVLVVGVCTLVGRVEWLLGMIETKDRKKSHGLVGG